MENGIEECTKFMDNAIADLDTCVYGLNDAKMQILQMIGKWIFLSSYAYEHRRAYTP